MQSSAILCHVALVRTDVSEGRIASIIRAKRIGDLGKMLAITIKPSKLRRVLRLLVNTNVEEWYILGCYALWLL
jgi:hypothetical protein